MRTVIRLTLTIMFTCLLILPAAAADTLSFKAGFLQLQPQGTIAVTAEMIRGDELNLEDDLGLDEDAGYFLETALQLGVFRLFASYFPLRSAGDGVLDRDVDFKGETFVAGSSVESDIDIDFYEAGLAWYPIDFDAMEVHVQLGPELAAKYVDAHLSLADETLSQREVSRVGIPVPGVGLRGRIDIADVVGVMGRTSYAAFAGSRFFDADLQVEYAPMPLTGVFVGYRYLKVDIDTEGIVLEASYAGPYLGALVRF